MTRFAFVVHPLTAADVARKYPFTRHLPDRLVEIAIARTPAKYVSEITGVRSATGAETTGWFVGCPLTSRQLLEWPANRVVAKVIEAARVAEELGAEIVGLGAYTAIVGDGGREVDDAVDIAVTTGNSYTVATAVEGTLKAGRAMGIDPAEAVAAVMGATGSIGRVCAHLLAEEVARILLVGRRREGLEEVAAELTEAPAEVAVSTSGADALPQADLIVTVTSALEAVVRPEMLRPGSVVCDVARPRDVSTRVADERDDVLVIEGGAVAVPGEVQFNFDFGFPPRTAYACMAETMILALEDRPESYSLGKRLELSRVREIAALADKHGFTLAGFRSFERTVEPRDIERIRQRAAQRAAALG
ncbi:MAG: shikimate dehydrogenase [Armatimonadota bacterium]